MTEHRNKPEDNQMQSDDTLDARVYASFKALGWAMPETEEEVAAAEQWLKHNPPKLPAILQDADAVFERESIPYTPLRPVTHASEEEIEENLARAAREGEDISTEIEEVMRRDREEAERRFHG